MDLGRIDEALADFDQAIALNPDYSDALWNRANARLLVGRYEEGWADYEWRWRAEPTSPPRSDLGRPQWRGGAEVRNKTLLLHAEQGFGDTIMVARYVRLLVEKGARIVIEAPDALLPLLAEIDGVAQVVIAGQTLPAFDLHCPMMSLPRAFGTTLDTIPTEVPYLSVPKLYREKWQGRLQHFR